MGRVLVVDDESSLHAVYIRIAACAGATSVDCATTADEAIALMGDHDYACILLDKNLPDLNGVALAEIIRHADPAARILIVTGFPTDESASAALRMGCFDYISKPFDVASMVGRLQHALRRSAP
jgi:DNA-binding response OmpR family regulator